MKKSYDVSQVQVTQKKNSPCEFEILFSGQPIPWKRAGKNGGLSYDAQAREKLFYGLSFSKHWDREPLKGSVGVHLEFRVRPSQAMKKKHGAQLEGVDFPRVPDLDNYCKFILDALTPLAWEDDCQIVALKARKLWSYEPGTLVSIYEVPTPSNVQSNGAEGHGD